MSSSAYVTFSVCVSIVILLAIFLIRWNRKSVSQGPALLTMLGIGGTFAGIATGLHAFRSADIQGSIPGLIDGIRTAVIASLVGVIGAILIKLRYAFDKHLDTIDAVADEDPLASEIRSLRKSICGDDDSSIVTQMKLGRIDTNTRLDAVIKSQAEFMQRMAEMSSKALIEALREVIADFNVKITEQFGDNFKQLNEAVGRLLTWQTQYKDQLEELINAQNETVQQMRRAVMQYEDAIGRTQSLVEVANDFRLVLDGIDAYKENLLSNTVALTILINDMTKATPHLQSAIETLVAQVSKSVIQNEVEVKRIGQEISSSFERASDAVRDSVTISLTSANKAVNENIGKLLGSTKELSEALQRELEATLTTSLESLAAQLASLSNRFAADYGPIADRLREIVRAST